MTSPTDRPAPKPIIDAADSARLADERLAADLRGFGPLGLLAIIAIYLGNAVFVPLSALLVLVWARWSRTPLREIGFVRPRSWLATLAVGILFGATLKLLMKAVAMPLLGADPINQAFHYLAGNRAAIPWTLYAMIVGAGFGEETVFRGYMFERLGKLFGSGANAKAAIVLITSIWFGLEHYSLQGLAGVEQATIVGLAFGSIFAITGRIFMLMVAHAAFDLTAYAMIYWDLEWDVAHLVFK
ncbi:MAG: CPBP family intramembrane metalloprotease [Gemmatimonadota bacterium]|nr:CPBP family intramembrane metalloprotease [Gemmatimonadota bacterium]